jgi:hypothetical protein
MTQFPVSNTRAARILLGAAIVLAASAASAAPILIPIDSPADPGDGIFASVIVKTNNTPDPSDDEVAFDVRGYSLAIVVESTTLQPLGLTFLFGFDPLPSNHFTVFNLAFSQTVELFLGFPGLLAPPVWGIPQLGVSGGTVTDPALSGLVGAQNTQYSLHCLEGETSDACFARLVIQTRDGFIVPYALDFIVGIGGPVAALPEPASICSSRALRALVDGLQAALPESLCGTARD